MEAAGGAEPGDWWAVASCTTNRPPWEVLPAPPPPRSSAAQISHFLSWAFWQILCLPRASSPHLLPGEFFLPWVSHSAAHRFLCLYLVATQ